MKNILYTIILIFVSIATSHAEEVIYLECREDPISGASIPSNHVEINKVLNKIFIAENRAEYDLVIESHRYIGKNNTGDIYIIYRDTLRTDWISPYNQNQALSGSCVVSSKRKNKI